MSRKQSIQRQADMRHETLRYLFARANRTGESLTEEQHLAAHMDSFRAGAKAMADAIAADIEALKIAEIEEADAARDQGKIVTFPFPGTEHRFTNWPKA
jgi:sarcosine oxidase delta subunit